VKLKPENISGSIASIENIWKQNFRNNDFKYSFLDEDIRANYSELDTIVIMFGSLAIISIVIACLGIFGLVSFTVERKTKEIAIRKVLGATVSIIFKNLTREFVLLIVIANVIAFPLAYLMIHFALDEYPFQAWIGPDTYMLGGIVAIILALITSAYHVTRAARSNPTDSLRYE
jgi:putative ABC transport system permease protein